MAKRSLIDYCILLQEDYIPNWHHELIAKKLEAVENGECSRLMLFMPPRHGKSELATKKFPAWYLGRNPSKSIICCSYSAGLAEEFGRDTRDTVDDPVHKGIFPDSTLRKGSKSATRWKVGRSRGGFLATGVGGSITGMGADVLIIDDPVKNRQEASSETYRKGVYDWYTSTAYTRLEKAGAIVIIQTRWHDEDLAGKILDREGEKGFIFDEDKGKWIKSDSDLGRKGRWDVIRFPAISTSNERYRKIGQALWPQKYDLKALKEMKLGMPRFDWSALYQQDPVDEETALFKKEWFQPWTTTPKIMKCVTAVDPAVSKKKSADDSVVLTLGRAMDDRMYILDERHGKWNPSELITEIFRQQEKWNSRVGIETVAYQQSLMHYMLLEQQKRKKYITLEQIRSSTKKEDRIIGLEPYYQNRLIYHLPGGMEDMEEQLKRFPAGKHDDIIDALAIAVSMAHRPGQYTQGRVKASDSVGLRWGKDGRPYIKK